MFSSPLQPLDETPATLVPANCPRPWATTFPACQRCVVTPGRSHIASVLVQNHRNNLSARVAFEVCCSCSGLDYSEPIGIALGRAKLVCFDGGLVMPARRATPWLPSGQACLGLRCTSRRSKRASPALRCACLDRATGERGQQRRGVPHILPAVRGSLRARVDNSFPPQRCKRGGERTATHP